MLMAGKFGFEPTAVPTIFIADRYWVGYAEEPIGREIEAVVASCALSGCLDAGAGVFSPAACAHPGLADRRAGQCSDGQSACAGCSG